MQDNIALNGACPSEMIEKALAIARAVIKQPDIFLIDEALTALDPSTEKKILKNLKEAFPKATVMIITHRDTILEAMDRVLVLHDKQFSDGMSVQELHENEAFKTLFSYSERER